MSEIDTRERRLGQEPKIKINSETKEWRPNLETILPIEGRDIPGFKAWINWNGFHLNRDTGKGHDGFDFGAYLTDDGRVIFGLPKDTKIRAIADGIVKQVLDDPEATGGGYGVLINLEHGVNNGGMFSRYVHVVPNVRNGTAVKAGDVIATLFQDPNGEEGRLVNLHFGLISGYSTRGGGGINVRTDDPTIIFDKSVCRYSAEPQGNAHFTIIELPDVKVETAHFHTIRVNDSRWS